MQRESDLGTETHDPRDANLERALADIEHAAAQQADLVIFGEMYLTGYRTDEWLHKWATVMDPPDRHVQKLLDCVKGTGVHVIMGMGTFGATMPGDVYNTALLAGPDGLIGAYRKTHVAAFPYSEGIAMGLDAAMAASTAATSDPWKEAIAPKTVNQFASVIPASDM